MTIQKRIEKVLDKIRPAMEADGGGIEFISWDAETKTAQVQLMGACMGCPMSQITLKNSVEVEIKKEVPEVKFVENVYN